MYYRWLDRWDERQSELGLAGQARIPFSVGMELAYPDAIPAESLADFCARSNVAVADPGFYEPDGHDLPEFGRIGDLVTFPSDIATDFPSNNTVSCRITRSGNTGHALVVFHHWGAEQRNGLLARLLALRGITVAELALPYHLERGRPGHSDNRHFVSPNLGRTVQALRQGVLDGRRVIGLLKSEGYSQISVLGMSLGSWVAGLVAAHDPSVKKAALMLTGGSAADVVWTGRATKLIRESLEPHVSLDELRQAWVTLDLGNYAAGLARPDLDLMLVLAKRDKVVPPEVSSTFLELLRKAGAHPRIREINCGHRSLGRFPHSLSALFALDSFLRH